jgi:carboxylesterase type B
MLLEAAGVRDVASLLALPAQRLIEAARVRDPSPVEDTALYLGPVMDGEVVPRHPFWPDAPPQSHAIPMVIGNTRDETRAFLGDDPAHHALSWDTLAAKLAQHQYVDLAPAVVIAEYRRLYPQYTPSEVFFAATTAGRSWRGAVEEAEARARQGAPTWVYQLDWASPLDEGRYRAFHTLDIPLVFDTVRQPGSRTGEGADARRMADRMSAALIAFARTGDPNHDGIPRWAPYSLPAATRDAGVRRSAAQRGRSTWRRASPVPACPLHPARHDVAGRRTRLCHLACGALGARRRPGLTHHTTMRLSGACTKLFLPGLQAKASAKGVLLASGPLTRYFAGACTSVRSRSVSSRSR